MFNHITPPPGGSDHTDQAAEPPHSRRSTDQRGIALQTIIIMVVLLAIAGAVAAVLFSRASTETQRLEDSESVEVYAITNSILCATDGNTWATSVRANGGTNAPQYADDDNAGLSAAGTAATMAAAITANDGYCHPTPP